MMSPRMRRREFITLLGGAAAAWPLGAGAQQTNRMRHIGILMPYPESDAEIQTRVRVFKQELERLGWIEGNNIQFDERWTTDNMDRVRANATSLVELKPDAIFAQGGRVIPILMEMTRSVPIIFPGGADPVGVGLVESLARPGGNVTGFSLIEFSVIGKMLEMLKQIAPNTSRVALIYNPDNPTSASYVRTFESSALRLALNPILSPIRGIAEFERAVDKLSEVPNGGVFFPPDVTVTARRDPIVALIARHRLPAVYSDFLIVRSGGLMSYSADRVDLFRRAASYVDRILRGEKPSDLPVQQPTKYDLVINLKTARELGLTVPSGLIAIADEVIE